MPKPDFLTHTVTPRDGLTAAERATAVLGPYTDADIADNSNHWGWWVAAVALFAAAYGVSQVLPVPF